MMQSIPTLLTARDWLADNGSATSTLPALIIGGIGFLFAFRLIWRLYFHPLAHFPGPKVAAVSDAWYAWHLLSGRYPFGVEDAIKEYGDVVRIAPNELVFSTPQALSDLYSTHTKWIEKFPKTQINNHGNDVHGGFIWEWDPIRHRQVSKKMAPAFGGRSLRAKEATLHFYTDLFIQRMKEVGSGPEGVSLPQWANWLAIDMSGDLAYNREMNSMRDMRNPPYLQILESFNLAIPIIQVCWRFPLLEPFKYIYLASMATGHSNIRKHSREQIDRRIRRRDAGGVPHLDFFDQIVPENREPPSDPLEYRHLEQVAGQLLVAAYEGPSLWFYFTIFHLLRNKDTVLKTLVDEIRTAFVGYGDITAESTAALPYLTACLKEGLRFMPNLLAGMPVVSPGAMVDGQYIPKGTICQSSSFALARSPNNFHDPLIFHPERWLPSDHPLYNKAFASDNLDGFHPFSDGPRACSGKELAWWQARILVAKMLWALDVEIVKGEEVEMDRDLKGWGVYVKPEVTMRFTPAPEKTFT